MIIRPEQIGTCQDDRSTSRASSTLGQRGIKLVVVRVGQIWSIGGSY